MKRGKKNLLRWMQEAGQSDRPRPLFSLNPGNKLCFLLVDTGLFLISVFMISIFISSIYCASSISFTLEVNSYCRAAIFYGSNFGDFLSREQKEDPIKFGVSMMVGAVFLMMCIGILSYRISSRGNILNEFRIKKILELKKIRILYKVLSWLYLFVVVVFCIYFIH